MRRTIIPDKDLKLHVWITRRTIHKIFSEKIRERYPLMVSIPDPKEGKSRLVNLSAREEYLGSFAAQKETATRPEAQPSPGDQPAHHHSH